MVRFKDIFDKYINNQATEKEIDYVENEIDKIEIINDYLANKIEDEIIINDYNQGFDYDKSSSVIEESDNTVKEIKKAINKKLVQVGVISALSVACFLLCLRFIVSPIMNKIYYNPLEKVDGYSSRMDIDLEIFSELHFPGVSNVQVSYEPLGFGKYDINIRQQDYIDVDNVGYSAVLNKNQFQADNGFYKYLPMNVFTRGTSPFYQYPVDADTEDMEKLKSLPDYIGAKVMVSFKEDLDVKEILDTLDGFDLDNNWIGVRSFPLDEQSAPLTGFVPNGTGLVFDEQYFDSEKYPYFDLGWVDFDKGKITPEILETHFESMLRYMADNEDFVKTDVMFKGCDSFYKEALEYIKSNGIKSYGVVVSGKPSEILKLRQHPMVEQIYVEDVFL